MRPGVALSVGDRLGHYDVTALIGEGGMGQVYQTTDTIRLYSETDGMESTLTLSFPPDGDVRGEVPFDEPG